MVSMDTLLLTAYFTVLLTLAIFGMHRYLMVFLYYRYLYRRPRIEARF